MATGVNGRTGPRAGPLKVPSKEGNFALSPFRVSIEVFFSVSDSPLSLRVLSSLLIGGIGLPLRRAALICSAPGEDATGAGGGRHWSACRGRKLMVLTCGNPCSKIPF